MSEERIEIERGKLARLGIYENKFFFIRELNGRWFADPVTKTCWEFNCWNGQKTYVPGVYEHLLDGTWHVGFKSNSRF